MSLAFRRTSHGPAISSRSASGATRNHTRFRERRTMEVYPPWLEMQDYCHLRHTASEPSFDQDAPEIFSQTDGGQTARIGGVGATTWKPCSLATRATSTVSVKSRGIFDANDRRVRRCRPLSLRR